MKIGQHLHLFQSFISGPEDCLLNYAVPPADEVNDMHDIHVDVMRGDMPADHIGEVDQIGNNGGVIDGPEEPPQLYTDVSHYPVC